MNSAGKTIRIVWCLVLALAVSTNVRAETQAIAGTPFGVARITMSLPPETSNTIEQAAGFSVHDPEGRVHYPAFTTGRLGELLGELLGNSRPRSSSSLTISFLFTGQEPLARMETSLCMAKSEQSQGTEHCGCSRIYRTRAGRNHRRRDSHMRSRGGSVRCGGRVITGACRRAR